MTENLRRVSLPETESMPIEINDLISRIDRLPSPHRQELEPTVARVVEYIRRRRRILGLVQDALTQLRLDMKYLMFDLEATRRERDLYRSHLDEGGNRESLGS